MVNPTEPDKSGFVRLRASACRTCTRIHRRANLRRHFCSQQLDRLHRIRVRQIPDADLRAEALVAEDLPLEQDLVDDLLRTSDGKRTTRSAQRFEVAAAHR